MTLEKTIQSMFDHFPFLFQDRADCLNHLFCVLGNEYEWVDGELIKDENREPIHDLVDGKAHQHQVLTARSAAVLRARIHAAQTRTTVDETKFANLPDTPPPRQPRRERWYFVHRQNKNGPETIDLYKAYVPLWNVPTDVKPDWLTGVQECLDMLIEDGVVAESDIT